jgi:hypothetical protein
VQYDLSHIRPEHGDWREPRNSNARMQLWTGMWSPHWVPASFFFGGGGLYTHSKGARTAAGRLHPSEAARPALMSRAAHAVESKAVVRIEVAVSPRSCLGCAVELVLRVAPALRRGVPPR